MAEEVEIRECRTLGELAGCVQLQREVFDLPEVEISPVRHFVVTINAGGNVLGAFIDGVLAGFTLSVPAFLRGERAYYSHMTAIRPDTQSHGLGTRLKWAQREKALAEGIRFIKWTFEPVKARNAYFNLEKLGATVREFLPDFYGTNYGRPDDPASGFDFPSDRLFAEWYLDDRRVEALASGDPYRDSAEPVAAIEITNDWAETSVTDPVTAIAQQTRIRTDFIAAFERGLVGRAFIRDADRPRYLLFES